MNADQPYRQVYFRAMGTDMTVILADSDVADGLIEDVRELFRAEEARFSRFLDDSELSLLNERGGGDVSEPFWDVLVRAMRWHEATAGDFDPAVLPGLLRAGYDRSFEAIADGKPHGEGSSAAGDVTYRFSDIEMRLEGERRHVRLQPGMRIDLSGIVKSWTVDRAAEALAPAGDFIMDGGGDIAARGDSPDGPGWWVGIEDPFNPGSDHVYLQLQDAAVATSGVYRRKWKTADGGTASHIIDPRSGSPVSDEVIAVTVTGTDAETCEIHARSALIRGAARGLGFLESAPGIEGLMTLEDGRRLSTSGWSGIEAHRDGAGRATTEVPA